MHAFPGAEQIKPCSWYSHAWGIFV